MMLNNRYPITRNILNENHHDSHQYNDLAKNGQNIISTNNRNNDARNRNHHNIQSQPENSKKKILSDSSHLTLPHPNTINDNSRTDENDSIAIEETNKELWQTKKLFSPVPFTRFSSKTSIDTKVIGNKTFPMDSELNKNMIESNDEDESEDNQKQNRDLLTKGRDFIVELLEEVSAHGFNYLAKSGLHLGERVIWIIFISISIFGIMSLGQRTWERFQTSPMVISMDRNKFVWNTSFPSLTVCPYKRIDEAKVDDYIEAHIKHFPTEEDKDIFREFTVNLANASYDNIEALVINKSFGIRSEKYLDLLHDLQWNFSPEMSSGTPVKMYIYETITELGVCHSVNSMIARYNSYEYWKDNSWAILEHGLKVNVHPLDGEIYAQIINLSTAYDVYFHGAMEVPDISKQKYSFPETDYTTVELTALEIFTAEEARAFSIKQRKCRFHYESEDMMASPLYSFGLCRTECRMKLSLKICKCIPHFYRNQIRTGQVLPVCGLEGFACLAKVKKELISLKSDTLKIDCECVPNCDDSNFFVQSYKSRVWFLGANLQWGINNYPKMQLRREILFTFADVLVYIGGLAGFFLGCSIISFTEFLYFFTARLIRRLFFN